MNKKENVIQSRSFEFAMEIIKFYKYCLDSNEYLLSKQLVRCGTSIGANVEEASAAQSKKGFYCENVNFIEGSTGDQILAKNIFKKCNN